MLNSINERNYSQTSIYRTRLIRHLIYIEQNTTSQQLTVLSIVINTGSFEHGYIEIWVIVKRPLSPCRLKQYHLYRSLHVTVIVGRRNRLQFMLISVWSWKHMSATDTCTISCQLLGVQTACSMHHCCSLAPAPAYQSSAASGRRDAHLTPLYFCPSCAQGH